MAKYNIGLVRKHFEKSLQTSRGGKVYSKQFKELLDAKKNPFLASKASKLTSFDRAALEKVAWGKDAHTMTDQEVGRALKALKKIGSGSEGVELTVFAKNQSPQESYKTIQKEQLKADTPAGPTPKELEHQKIVHERRMNVARLYRQWAIDKEQGGVMGGRFQPGSNARTSALNRDDPRGSVTPDPDKAQGSVSDTRTAATSASDRRDDATPPGGGTAPTSSADKAEKPSSNPDTSVPSLVGGVPGQNAAEKPDVGPVTEGTMRVDLPPADAEAETGSAPPAAPAPEGGDNDSGSKNNVDNDLPLGP